MKALKRTLIILIIILLELISFGGIYVQKYNSVKNILKEFKLGASLTGSRDVGLAVSSETKEVIYDKDGNVVDQEGEETTKKEEPVNKEEALTKENYKLVKKIMEERLKTFKEIQYTPSGIKEAKAIDQYIIKQNDETGEISLQIPENNNTNRVIQYVATKGTFNIVDDQDNVLIDNSHIEKTQVGYSSTNNGVTVYLTIQFNKEGTAKLKEISNTFVKTTDEEGNDTTKKITVKVDDTKMLTTYFAEEISNGMIQLSFGTAKSNSEDLVNYAQEAYNLSVLLNTGNLPIVYTIDENRYVLADTNMNLAITLAIVVASVIFIGILFLIFKYKLNGLLGSISLIGYIAALLIIVRLTNVIITLEGIAGILTAIILNYIFIVYLLNSIKNSPEFNYKKVLTQFICILIPITVITIIFCFVKWLPIYSFGMTMFWGIALNILYNVIITRTLICKK